MLPDLRRHKQIALSTISGPGFSSTALRWLDPQIQPKHPADAVDPFVVLTETLTLY